MPRRIADYAATNGWTQLNQLSTIGSAILGLGVLPFVAGRGPRDAQARHRAAQSVGRRHARVVDRLSAAARQLPRPAADPIEPTGPRCGTAPEDRAMTGASRRGPAARVDGRLRTSRGDRVLVPDLRGGRNPAADRVRDRLRHRCGRHPREASMLEPRRRAREHRRCHGRAGRRSSSGWVWRGWSLGVVFGPWLAIGGILLAVVGGWIWLSTAMTEADPGARATHRDD